MNKWLFGIAASLAVGLVGFGGNLLWNHWAQAQEDHIKQAAIEDLARSNYAVVEQLRKIHESQDAKTEKVRELCLARQLTDRTACAEAGVELP